MQSPHDGLAITLNRERQSLFFRRILVAGVCALMSGCPVKQNHGRTAMKRRTFLEALGFGAAGALYNAAAKGAEAPGRPNILWITNEDISPNLGCYGDPDAITPHLDAFARESVLYSQAFGHAPVCAPARSGIISGMYPQSLGSHHMRCSADLPPGFRCFPAYLRDAGYYCTNNKKKDYNFSEPRATWDESSPKAHWRNRKAGQPFFSVFNFTGTHESRIRMDERARKMALRRLTEDQFHDPAEVHVPPWHPDTPVVRRDWANYHDNITAFDYEFQQMLDMLEKDGLAEDTIVFYYSDHGAGMPRGKRWCYDAGIQVPLIIRFPEKYRHLAPAAPGSKTDRPVCFIDFGPAALSLCGVKVPETMQGRPFLGNGAVEARPYIRAGRDRMDERYDCTRVIRNHDYKYIRNFMPHKPWAQYLDYMYQMPTMQEWQRLKDAGRLDGPEANFMRDRKPPEELYELKADPGEVNNLADDPQHKAALEEMRAMLRTDMLAIRDLGLMPEGDMHRLAKGRPFQELGRDDTIYPLERLLDTADLVLQEADTTVPELIRRLGDDTAPGRFQAVIALEAIDARGDRIVEALKPLLEDESPDVRVVAARALCLRGVCGEAVDLLAELLFDDNEWVCVRAACALDDIGESARPALAAMQREVRHPNKYVERVLDHALAELSPET
jgi:N-sulfoglucosamine sulfohydrolase